jgi:cell wall-associated NlpC family hydrolase
LTNFDDLIGLPFADGGRGPNKYDCWGLVREVYRRFGVNLPDYPISAWDTVKIGDKMAQEKRAWLEVKKPLPIPALVVIQMTCGSWANHVGVYIGENRFIHAYAKTGIVIDRIKNWQSSIAGFYVPRGD